MRWGLLGGRRRPARVRVWREYDTGYSGVAERGGRERERTSWSSLADSKTVTAWPESEADMAVARPLRPAPTTVMLSLTPAVGCGLSVCAMDLRLAGKRFAVREMIRCSQVSVARSRPKRIFMAFRSGIRRDRGSRAYRPRGVAAGHRRWGAGPGSSRRPRTTPHLPHTVPHTAAQIDVCLRGTGCDACYSSAARGIPRPTHWFVHRSSGYRRLDSCQGYPAVESE